MDVCTAYCKCSIEFHPNDRQARAQKYSDRSSLELRHYDLGNYSLRALDIANGNQKIFDISLDNENQYVYGAADNPDQIRNRDGTYHLSLDKASSETFYKELRKRFEEIKITRPQGEPPQQSRTSSQAGPPPPKPQPAKNESRPSNPTVFSPKDFLLNIHQLSEHIEEGDAADAAQIASELASKGPRLQVKSSGNIQNEHGFTVQVQLDGNEYGIDQHGAKIPVDVFSSTTVRELRALFELTHHFLPPNQYFFVNGHLVHDDSTMKELKVGPNSLFVLFLLTHQKTYSKRGPWKCTTCEGNNQEADVRCKIM